MYFSLDVGLLLFYNHSVIAQYKNKLFTVLIVLAKARLTVYFIGTIHYVVIRRVSEIIDYSFSYLFHLTFFECSTQRSSKADLLASTIRFCNV